MVDHGHQLRGPGPAGRQNPVLSAALAVLLVLVAGLALQGCGPPTPEAQVRGFLDAWNGQNEARAASLAMEGDISAFKTGDTFLLPERPGFSVGTPDIQGEKAYVPVTFHTREGDLEAMFVLVERERTWKISLTQTMSAWVNSHPGGKAFQ